MRYFLKKTAENLDWKFFQFRSSVFAHEPISNLRAHGVLQ